MWAEHRKSCANKSLATEIVVKQKQKYTRVCAHSSCINGCNATKTNQLKLLKFLELWLTVKAVAVSTESFIASSVCTNCLFELALHYKYSYNSEKSKLAIPIKVFSTVFKATLLNHYEARGCLFCRLKIILRGSKSWREALAQCSLKRSLL